MNPSLRLLLMTSVVMFTSWAIARRRGYVTEPFPGFKEILTRFVAALPGLLLVALIFLGIRAGIFTAVESAAIAVFYAILVTGLVYRRLTWQHFVETCMGAVRTTGLILFVIGAAASFGWLLAYMQVPSAAVEALTSIADDKYVILIALVLVLRCRTHADADRRISLTAGGLVALVAGVCALLNARPGSVVPVVPVWP